MSEHVSGETIPHLSGYSEAELDQAFAAIARDVEASAAALSVFFTSPDRLWTVTRIETKPAADAKETNIDTKRFDARGN